MVWFLDNLVLFVMFFGLSLSEFCSNNVLKFTSLAEIVEKQQNVIEEQIKAIGLFLSLLILSTLLDSSTSSKQNLEKNGFKINRGKLVNSNKQKVNDYLANGTSKLQYLKFTPVCSQGGTECTNKIKY